MRSVRSSAHELKKYWGRKNMNSVLEGFVSVPMCISRPNQATWSERRMITLSMSVLDLKNASSSTQRMQNISKRVPD